MHCCSIDNTGIGGGVIGTSSTTFATVEIQIVIWITGWAGDALSDIGVIERSGTHTIFDVGVDCMLIIVIQGVVGHVAGDQIRGGWIGDILLKATISEIVVDLSSWTFVDNLVT